MYLYVDMPVGVFLCDIKGVWEFMWRKKSCSFFSNSVNLSLQSSLTPSDENEKFSTLWEQMCGNCFPPSFRLGQGSHSHKKQTHMQKRHRTQTQFVIYFQEGDFFRGTACLILCGRENLMPLNRFSPGKGEKLDLRTGNFIWKDSECVGRRRRECRGGEE